MDKYDEQAERLIEHCRYCEMPEYRKCRSDHEHAVEDLAAELRKQGQRIERLEAALANALAELHCNFGCDEQCVAQRHVVEE